MIKDLLTLFNLVSDCIEFNHPLILDIRYYFHLKVSGIHFVETWERETWEEYVSEQCKYTLKEFIMAFCKDAHFRHNILAVMGTDVERLKDSVKYFGG